MPSGRIKAKPFLRWSPRNFRFVRKEDGDHPSFEVLLKQRDRWKSELDKSVLELDQLKNKWPSNTVDKRVELEGAKFRSPDLDLTAIVHILNQVKVGAESVFVSKDAPHADVLAGQSTGSRRWAELKGGNSDPHPIHNFAIFDENQGLWAASYSSKSLIFLACLH